MPTRWNVTPCTIAARRREGRRGRRRERGERNEKEPVEPRRRCSSGQAIADGWEVSPRELDYRVASVGFENRGVSTAAGRGCRVIDFAYDTDWTGLRNWTGFLAWFSLSLFLCPLPWHLPFQNRPSSSSSFSIFFSISRVSVYMLGRLYRRARRAYTYVDVTYILNVSSGVYLARDEEGFPLVSLWRRTEKGIGLERAICAIFEDVFMSVSRTLLPLSYCVPRHFPRWRKLLREKSKRDVWCKRSLLGEVECNVWLYVIAICWIFRQNFLASPY